MRPGTDGAEVPPVVPLESPSAADAASRVMLSPATPATSGPTRARPPVPARPTLPPGLRLPYDPNCREWWKPPRQAGAAAATSGGVGSAASPAAAEGSGTTPAQGGVPAVASADRPPLLRQAAPFLPMRPASPAVRSWLAPLGPAVATRPCHKYRFLLRVRYTEIVTIEYAWRPHVSSCVSIRDIPGKHGYESIPESIDWDQLPTFSSAQHLFSPSMSERFRHVSESVGLVLKGLRENSNGRPLASTPGSGDSPPTRILVAMKSCPKFNWYLADVKRHNCGRMAGSSGSKSAVGRN